MHLFLARLTVLHNLKKQQLAIKQSFWPIGNKGEKHISFTVLNYALVSWYAFRTFCIWDVTSRWFMILYAIVIALFVVI